VLAAQIHGAVTEAVRTNGDVAVERLEALGRLARLADMADAATTPLRRRWAVRLVALGTLVCASVLLFARMSSTEVELELKVSEFSFVLPTVQAITDEISVATLGVSGLTAIELPSAPGGSEATQSASDIYLAARESDGRAGAVSLSPITLPAGSRVTLRKLDERRRYRLALRGATSELAVSVNGPTHIVVPAALNEVGHFSFPRRITLEPDSHEVALDVAIAERAGAPNAFRSPLPVESLLLFRVDRFDEGGQTLIRQVSTIDSGTLYFESIEGRARPLRAGEGLRFASSAGEISEWHVADDGVRLRFHGRVKGMSSGSGEIERSLMPTVLDWLRAQHGLSLLWGTTAYVVGLFITVLGWRRPA
jgi:hypothetical protein